MALRRIMGRLTLQNPIPSPLLRCLSTETTPNGVVSEQPRPTRNKRALFNKVKSNPKWSNVTNILNEWVSQGNAIERRDFIDLVSYFRSRKDFRPALQIFYWMEKNLKVELTDGDAAVLIDLLCKSEGLASAEKYFNSLPDSEKTNKTYGALLSCYCREKAVDKALEIFEKMKELNYLSSLNYTNMMSLYYGIEQPEKVISLAQEMEEKQITPTGYTYNLLLNSYAARKDLDAIEEVFGKMRSSDVKCDYFTYGNLANIYVKAGLHEKAKACLEILETTQDLRREEIFEACRTRVKLYADMNDLSGVDRAWKTLKSTFRTPNNTAYLFTLLAFLKLGELDSLEKLFKEWEEGSNEFDIRLPNVMLGFYLSKNLIERASALYESLITVGVRPSLKTLEFFAHLCMKTGRIDMALEYLERGVDKARAQNAKWFPTDETIKLFLNYFEEKNDGDRAQKFIQSMKQVDNLDSTVYGSLLLKIET